MAFVVSRLPFRSCPSAAGVRLHIEDVMTGVWGGRGILRTSREAGRCDSRVRDVAWVDN